MQSCGRNNEVKTRPQSLHLSIAREGGDDVPRARPFLIEEAGLTVADTLFVLLVFGTMIGS